MSDRRIAALGVVYFVVLVGFVVWMDAVGRLPFVFALLGGWCAGRGAFDLTLRHVERRDRRQRRP